MFIGIPANVSEEERARIYCFRERFMITWTIAMILLIPLAAVISTFCGH